MEKRTIFVILLTFGLALQQSVQAQRKSTIAEKILLFGAGYLTGHAAHELGHQTAAWARGVKLKWKLEPQFPYLVYDTRVYEGLGNPHDGNWTWDRDAPTLYGLLPVSREQVIVATGGFAGEFIASEIILASSSLKTDDGGNNYFLLGWLAMTIVSPFANSIRDGVTRGGYGDIQTIRDMGQNEKVVEAFILAHALVTAARVAIKLGNHGEHLQVSSTPTSVTISLRF